MISPASTVKAVWEKAVNWVIGSPAFVTPGLKHFSELEGSGRCIEIVRTLTLEPQSIRAVFYKIIY